MTTDFYAALQKLLNEVHDLRLEAGNPSLRSAVTEARAALAEQPVMPTDEEIMELMPRQMHEDLAAAARAMAGQAGTDNRNVTGMMRIILNRHAVDLARAVLARWGNPAPQPVPVSERLQQMEDLAADAVAGLRYIEQSHGRLYGVGWDRVYKKADRLKPAHALPVPGQEVEG